MGVWRLELMKAVLYCRFSSDKQNEASIKGQLRECKAFAEKNGMTIVGNYIDRALSAKSDARPEFQKMIKDSAKRLFDVVIVWKLDRFSRDRFDSAHYKRILRLNGVKVVSATEAIAEDSTGILLESLLEGYAEFYSVELAEKVRRGLTENALKCKYNGGNVPLGYYIDDELHYQIDSTTSAFIFEAFERYNDGHKLKEIVTWLNDSGVRTKRNHPVSIDTVNRILKNRNYVGDYHYDKHIIPGGVPAIVPPDLFEQVQEKLSKNRKAPARAKAVDEYYLLSTKIFCGLCSAYMIGESGHSSTGKVHYYYKCATAKKNRSCKKKTVKKAWIEDIVVNKAMQLINDDKILEKIADAILQLQTQENITFPMLKKQLAETERGIENMLNAIQQGILNQSTKKRLDDLEEAKSDIEVKILQEEIHKPLLSREQILFWLHKFRGIDVSKQDQRQLLIDTFINSIYLYDDKLVITFNSKEGAKTLTLTEIEETFRSDLTARASPRRSKVRFALFPFAQN